MGRVLLGDGREELFEVFETTVVWDGQSRVVEVDAADTDALVGMALLDGYELRIAVTAEGSVEIRALP
jgi:predicted aspartyl protease